MILFDSHIHCQLLNAGDRYCSPCLVPAVSAHQWSSMVSRFAAEPEVWLALGVHPQASTEWCDGLRTELAAYLGHPSVVAVGEIGLDGHLDINLDLQEQVFRQQLQLAVAADKPVIVHAFRCYDRLLTILKQEQVDRVGGIVHGFSASADIAKHLCDMGVGIGVGRIVLNSKARRLPEAISCLPDHMLVVETDAPWRSSLEAGYDWTQALVKIISRLAALRGCSVEKMAEITATNSRRLLKLNCDNSLK